MIEQLTGERSIMCLRCRVHLKEKYEKTVRRFDSPPSALESASEYVAPPPFTNDNRSHSDPECGKFFSTNSYSSFSAQSSSQRTELWGSPGESSRKSLYELGSPGTFPWLQSSELPDTPLVELDSSATYHEMHHGRYHEMGSSSPRVPSVSNISQTTSFNNFTPPTEILSASSTEISPFSSGTSPDTGIFLETMPHQYFATDSEQPTVNFACSTSDQLSHLTAVCDSEPQAQISFQNPFTPNATHNRRDPARAERNTPPLALSIPSGNKHSEDFSLVQSVSDASLVTTPTVQSFRHSMARCSTNASNQSRPVENNRHQQEIMSHSDNISLFRSATFPTSKNNSSSASSSETRCEICDWTPRAGGKREKSTTYLQKHRKTHCEDRHHCPSCNKSYSRKDNLVAHSKKCNGHLVPSPRVGRKNLCSRTSGPVSEAAEETSFV